VNEEAKARYRAVENTSTIGCNAKKTNETLSKGEINNTFIALKNRTWTVAYKRNWILL
jgi:hypothetical protein